MSYVTAAVAIGGALYQGSEARQSGAIAKIFADSQARMDEAAALETAKIIRRAGRKAVGAASAGYAGAGVKVGEGSAAEVGEEITAAVEHDAYQAILEGKNRASSARQAGRNADQAGRDAQTASIISATGTALGAYNAKNRTSSPGTGWRTNGPGFSGTQAPAPVYNAYPKG
jgi:hypothetical protein